MKSTRMFVITRPLLAIVALVAISSCQKKALLQAEVKDQERRLEQRRELIRVLDERLRAFEATASERKAAMQYDDKLGTAQKQLKEVTAALKTLNERIAEAEEKQKETEAELAAYKKQTGSL